MAELDVSSLVFNDRQVLFHPLWDCFRYVFNISLAHDLFLHATVVHQKFYEPPRGFTSAP